MKRITPVENIIPTLFCVNVLLIILQKINFYFIGSDTRVTSSIFSVLQFI